MTRLRDAAEAYNRRALSIAARAESSRGRYSSVDASRGIVTGTDIPFDEMVAFSELIAAEQINALVGRDTTVADALAGLWRAGLITGVLFALREHSEDSE